MIIVKTKQPVTIEKGIQTDVYFMFIKDSLVLRNEKDENGVLAPYVTIDFVELIKDSNDVWHLYRTNRIRYKKSTWNLVTTAFDYTGGCFGWMDDDDDAIADVVINQIDYTTNSTTPPSSIEEIDKLWYYGLTSSDLEKVTINEPVQY